MVTELLNELEESRAPMPKLLLTGINTTATNVFTLLDYLGDDEEDEDCSDMIALCYDFLESESKKLFILCLAV
jgi:hypothetical protein